MSASEAELRRWAETLSGLARTGIGFTESPYERERYEEILAVAADLKASADGEDALDAPAYVTEWMKGAERGSAGYVTPKVAVGAIVVNERDELLMIQRSDSGVWLYPTGWADIGYSAPEVVVKEVKEETGIDAEVVRLIGVLDGMRLGLSRIPLYSLIFLCRAVGGTLAGHPHETLDLGWFAQDSLPANTLGAERWSPAIFAAIRDSSFPVFYDDVRRPVWRGSDEH
jgi:ADP-ribose pyrophosphatase YjhB (NUDIX family)